MSASLAIAIADAVRSSASIPSLWIILMSTNLSVLFGGHAVRLGLALVDPGVPGHQQEEREVHHGQYPRDQGVGRGGGHQAQPAEADETDHEQRQKDLVDRAAIADRLDLAPVQPGQEEED